MFVIGTSLLGCRGRCKRWVAARRAFPWRRLRPVAAGRTPWCRPLATSPPWFPCERPDRRAPQCWMQVTLTETQTEFKQSRAVSMTADGDTWLHSHVWGVDQHMSSSISVHVHMSSNRVSIVHRAWNDAAGLNLEQKLLLTAVAEYKINGCHAALL